MKVQLEAFNGKLRSDYIDWPDNMMGQDIKLLLDISGRGKWITNSKLLDYSVFHTKVGTFEYTRTAGVYMHPDGTSEVVHLYKLVDLS